MNNKINNTLPLIGIFSACLVFVLIFTFIQLSPLLQLGTDDLITHKSHWFPANSRIASPEEAASQPYTAYKGVLATGNLKPNYWIKLTVKPSQSPSLLAVGPANVDQIDVWQRNLDGSWQLSKGGIQRREASQKSITLFYTVPVVAHPTEANGANGAKDEILINVRSNTAYLQTRVYPQEKILEYDAGLRTGFGFFLGISLWVFTICLVVWMATQDPIWLEALLYDLSFSIFASTHTGMLFKAFPFLIGELASTIYALSVVGVTVAICRFTIVSTNLFERPDWLIKPYKLGYLVSVFSATLIISGHTGYALSLTNLYLALICLWGFVLIIGLRKGNFLLLITYKLLLVLYTVIPLLFIGSAFLNISPSNTLIHVASPQNNIFTMVMILMLLGFRAWSKTKEQIATAQEKELLTTRLEMEQEKLAETSGFLSMIVHEIKNPLNHIRLAITNLSSESNLSDYAQRTLGKAHTSINNIDIVLERSIEAEDQTIQAMQFRRQKTNLTELTDELISHFPHAEHQRILVSLPVSLSAHIDREVVGLAIRNLLENAIKYSAPETEVQLSAELADGLLKIRVSNVVGPTGFPDETQLFQKYYRSREAMHISGTGLGLYWVRQVMRLMSGDVYYTCTDNQTIRFELWIPA